MDGSPNKNEAKNKQYVNQPQRQSRNILQSLNSQPTNHQLVKDENSTETSHWPLNNESSSSGDGAASSNLGNHRHSLSSSFTANGTPSTCFVSNAVVRASSTGTLSSSSSRCYAQVTKAEDASSNVSNSDFVTSFSSSSQSGAICSPAVGANSTCSNAANGFFESMPLPLPFGEHFGYPNSSSPPPHNRDQAMHNWQDNQTCVKERLEYLYKTHAMSDIQFRVGKPPTQLVHAHKFVLSIGSAVFDALFNGRLATTDAVIDIPDVEPAAFSALLKFLYTDEVQIGPETVMTTLYAAKKYAVPALEHECVDFLKHNLSPDNAFMLLTQARLFDEPQLAALCLETIDKNTAEALSADGFTDIDLDTLCAVLERDTLGIRECRLFTAVCKWAEAECLRRNLVPSSCAHKRQVLSKALRLIRFPLMTVEEFAMGSAQSGILEDREVVELFLFFTVNPKPSTSFLDIPRCCLTGKEQVVSRFCQIESRWGYSGTSDRIRFLVNRRIFVVGFGLYGSIHGPTEYSVNIQIIHMDSTKVLGSNDPTFQCDGSTSTFRVMFKEPVEILPNTSYIACATLKGPDSYYGSKGLRKVTHESVASGKVTFQFTYAAGNNNGTSVEDGQIPEIVFYT